jgi:hypothetical protein
MAHELRTRLCSAEAARAGNHRLLLFAMEPFEAQQMANRANAKRICDRVRQWELQDALNLQLFEEPLQYFRNRYFSHGGFTYHFNALNFRPPDRRPLVETVLSGASDDAVDVVTALLLIAGSETICFTE